MKRFVRTLNSQEAVAEASHKLATSKEKKNCLFAAAKMFMYKNTHR
jgi:hypothetical protein